MPLTPQSARQALSTRIGRSHLISTGVLLATIAAGFGACGPGDPSDKGTGGTMIIVLPAEPSTLFPPRATQSQERVVIASVFDRLAEIGQDLNTTGDAGFIPRLASSWTWASDSMSIAFAIDPRARWHDGTPVKAEDVKYTFHVYTSDAVLSEARSLLGNIDSVSVRDSMTAVVWFKRRTPQQFMDATYSMWILPSHLLASIPDSALANAPFGRQPVGSGRFRFAKWEAGSRLEIIADTANLRGRAKLDRVILTFVGDAGAATVKLFAGEADLIERIRPENISQITGKTPLRLEANMPLRYGFVGFNLRARRSALGPAAPPHPVLGDIRVRRALTMALDRDRMVRSTLDSLGMVAFGPAPRALIPDTTGLRPIAYDVAHAKALLDSAGWIDATGDGIREHEGQPLKFELLVPSSSPTRVKLSVLVQAALKDVGAEVVLQNIDGPAIEPRLDARDFDAWMGGYDINPGLQGTRQTWESRGSWNYQGYISPAFDALLDSALTTFDARRTPGLWSRALQRAIDDAPSAWLYEERVPLVVNTRIKVAPLRADAWYANLADWSIYPGKEIDRDRVGLGGAR